MNRKLYSYCMPCGRPWGLGPIRAGPRWRMYDVCVGQRKRTKAGSVGFIWTWLEFLIGLLGGEGRQGCPSLSWQLLLLSNTSTPGFRSLMCLHSIIDLVCVLHSTCHDFIYCVIPHTIDLFQRHQKIQFTPDLTKLQVWDIVPMCTCYDIEH